MTWIALVPLKAARDRKSRLGSRLSEDERVALSEHFARHVGETIAASPSISSTILLSDVALDQPPFTWVKDEGGGLNRELARAVAALGRSPVVIVSADLPLLGVADIEAMVEGAHRYGAAIAPDRHGTGTNALALASPAGFRFRFGADSFSLHRGALPAAAIVRRRGLMLDVDTPDDLAVAIGEGAQTGLNLPALRGAG